MQKPDEFSAEYERVCAYGEKQAARKERDGVNRVGESKMPGRPEETLVVVAPYDGIGGARRALEILGIKPSIYVAIEDDPDCAAVVRDQWPDTIRFGKIENVTDSDLKKAIPAERMTEGIVVAGPPCQPFSKLNSLRAGFNDERSDGIGNYVSMVKRLVSTFPTIRWHDMMENLSLIHI